MNLHSTSTSPHARHRLDVCPWWLGYVLANPLRRLIETPEKLVLPFVRPGDTVLEVGPGMGFFTVPMARAVGETGRVVCVDVQSRMIEGLRRRLDRQGLSSRVATRVCEPASLGVDDFEGRVDVAFLVYVLHEVPDQAACLAQIRRTLRVGGRLLILEPRGHCSDRAWRAELETAKDAGLEPTDAAAPASRRRWAALLARGVNDRPSLDALDLVTPSGYREVSCTRI